MISLVELGKLKNLTPQPPSLQGKGEQKREGGTKKKRASRKAPLLAGEGFGEGSVPESLST